MSQYDFKEGDVVRFENALEYNYTTEQKKTVARIVNISEYSEYDPYYEEKDDEALVQIIAMEDIEDYEFLSKRSFKAIFPVKKRHMIHYKGEYDDIFNVKMLLLQNGYYREKIKEQNRGRTHDINSLLLEGF